MSTHTGSGWERDPAPVSINDTRGAKIGKKESRIIWMAPMTLIDCVLVCWTNAKVRFLKNN